MGSTHSLTPKEGNESFVLTGSLLQDFQSCMTLVDNTVFGVAKAIDTLSLLFQRLGNNGDGKCSDGPNQPEDMEKIVFHTMTECLSQQKNIMIESVVDLLTLIVESSKDHVELSDGGLTSFRLSTYKNKAADSKSSANFMTEFLERSLASMRKQVEHLNDKINIQSAEMRELISKNTLEKKLEHYEKEQSQTTLRATADDDTDDYVIIENMETNKQETSELQGQSGIRDSFWTEKEGQICKTVTQEQQQQRRQHQHQPETQIEPSSLKLQMKKLADDNTNFRIDCNEILSQLEVSKKENALCMKETNKQDKANSLQSVSTQTSELVVQVYHKSSSSSELHADGQLHVLLKNEVLKKGYFLTTIPATPTDFDESIPFLATCNYKAKSKFFRDNTLTNALDEFKSRTNKTTKVMILLFYEVSDSVVEQAIETVKDSKRNICNIHRVKCSMEHKLIQSKENDKVIEKIVDFIEAQQTIIVMESSV